MSFREILTQAKETVNHKGDAIAYGVAGGTGGTAYWLESAAYVAEQLTLIIAFLIALLTFGHRVYTIFFKKDK